MDSENNARSSLQLLHAYDSEEDSSDESNQNISEKYITNNVTTNSNNVNAQSQEASSPHEAPATEGATLRSSEEGRSNNNGEFHPGSESVEMSHRGGQVWIEESSGDEDSDSSSSSEWESLKGDDICSDSNDSTDDNENNANARGGATFCNKRVAPKVKGELAIEDLPPIQEMTISVPNNQCVHIGNICNIIDQLVVVKTLPDKPILDLDTVLFLDEGARTLGQIYDVFGQVTEPFYCVRFNSKDHIKDKGIEKNMLVYYAPKAEYTHLVYTSDLMKAKGSDASWKDDVETPEQLCDYSDDEAERKAKQKVKEMKKKTVNANNAGGESTSGNKKPKLTPFEIKMNKINLEKTAEAENNTAFRLLCTGGRGLGRGFFVSPPNNSMDIRSQARGRGRGNIYTQSNIQRSGPSVPFENPFDIPHGIRMFSTQYPRFPPIPGPLPIPPHRPAFSPPPGHPIHRFSMSLFARATANSLGLNRNPRPGGGPWFSDDRPNF